MQEPNLPTPPHGLIGLQTEPGLFTGAWPIALGIFSLFLGILAYLWYRRRRALQTRELKPSQNPWQLLSAEVQKLSPPSPTESAHAPRVGDFYVQLSHFLRAALELRYGFPATGQTLQELRHSLEKLPGLDGDLRGAFLSFFDLAEGIKFAGQPGRDHGLWQEKILMWIRILGEQP